MEDTKPNFAAVRTAAWGCCTVFCIQYCTYTVQYSLQCYTNYLNLHFKTKFVTDGENAMLDILQCTMYRIVACGDWDYFWDSVGLLYIKVVKVTFLESRCGLDPFVYMWGLLVGKTAFSSPLGIAKGRNVLSTVVYIRLCIHIHIQKRGLSQPAKWDDTVFMEPETPPGWETEGRLLTQIGSA